MVVCAFLSLRLNIMINQIFEVVVVVLVVVFVVVVVVYVVVVIIVEEEKLKRPKSMNIL